LALERFDFISRLRWSFEIFFLLFFNDPMVKQTEGRKEKKEKKRKRKEKEKKKKKKRKKEGGEGSVVKKER